MPQVGPQHDCVDNTDCERESQRAMKVFSLFAASIKFFGKRASQGEEEKNIKARTPKINHDLDHGVGKLAIVTKVSVTSV